MIKNPYKIDLTGHKFHRLTVVSYHSKDPNGCSKWVCRCDCGKETIVLSGNLKKPNGKGTTSCGCAHSEIMSDLNKTHGDFHSKENYAWSGAKSRTTNPKHKRYSYYGGRGIQMCQRWLDSYENFLADMGRCPPGKRSIERKNNDGNYEPGNCCWATHSEQMKNRRRKVA